jgi:L-asparagine transporter-like permease
MKNKYNYYWGLLGILGILGYVLDNPIYYVFFIFFLFFLSPIKNKKDKNEENESSIERDYKLYKVSIWIGSAILIVDSLYLMATKTMNDFTVIGLLLGIIIYVTSFFAYMGMEKKSAEERLRKIGTLAVTWSWYITLTFICFLVVSMYWAQRIHDPVELMGLTIFVMVTTMLIANTILGYRGDID